MELYLAHVDLEFKNWELATERQDAQRAYRAFLTETDREGDVVKWARQAKRRLGINPLEWDEADATQTDDK